MKLPAIKVDTRYSDEREVIEGVHLSVSLSIWQFIHRKVAKDAE
jgi:hypothetical protein